MDQDGGSCGKITLVKELLYLIKLKLCDGTFEKEVKIISHFELPSHSNINISFHVSKLKLVQPNGSTPI